MTCCQAEKESKTQSSGVEGINTGSPADYDHTPTTKTEISNPTIPDSNQTLQILRI